MSTETGQLTAEDLKNMSPEELKELQKKNCIFCNIISGRIQSKKIYEDDKVLAILDINPANPGHLLVMPKEHYTIMPQMPDYEAGYMAMVTKALSQACLKALKAEGSNVFVANGVAAGQRSPHFMLHIIPRKSNDGISSFGLQRRKADKSSLVQLQNQIFEKVKELMHDNHFNLGATEEEHEEESENIPPTSSNKPIISEPIINAQQTNTSHQSQLVSQHSSTRNITQTNNSSENNVEKSPEKQIPAKQPTTNTEKTVKKEEPKGEVNLDDIARVLLGR